MASYKMASLARQLREDLSIRLPALACVQTVDASGNAVVTVGTLAAASQSAFIRLLEQPSIGADSLGLAQRSYGPHVVQIVLETSTIANVPLMTVANELFVLGAALKHGVKVEIYLTANATGPSVSGITGVPAASFDNLWQPLTSSM